MKFKKFISTALLLSLLVAAFSSCAAPSDSGDTGGDETSQSDAEGGGDNANASDVVIWAFAQPHAEYFEWVTNEYTADNPDVTFSIEIMDNASLQDRLAISISSDGEGAPDLVDIEQGQFPRYMNSEKMIFEPLNDRIDADGLSDKLVESRLALYEYEDTYYGLEHALCPVTIAYRPDLFEKAGITEFPSTWDGYMEAAEKLKAVGINIIAMESVEIGGGFGEAETYLMAADNHYVGDDGNININDQTTAMWEDFAYLEKNGMAYTYETDDERWNAFNEDLVATYVTPDWAAGWLRDNVPDQNNMWEMTYLPQLTSTSARTSSSGGTGVCMVSYTEHDKDMLWDFMKFAMVDADNSVTKYEMISLYPPVYDAMEACNTPVEYYGGQNLGEMYQELAPEMPEQPQAAWRSYLRDAYKEFSYDWFNENITTEEFVESIITSTEEQSADAE